MNNTFTRLSASLVMAAFAIGAYPADTIQLSIGSEEDFSAWTVVNANGDDYEFVYDAAKEGAFLDQNKNMAYDDWLISPAVRLEGGKSYSVQIYCKKVSTFSIDKQVFDITYGTAPEASAQTNILSGESAFTSTYFKYSPETVTSATKLITPADDGTFYIGIHNRSSNYNGGFVVQSMKISEMVNYPGAVTGITSEAAPEGAQQLTLGWTWPVTNNNGGTLCTALEGAYIYRGNSNVTATEANLVGTAPGGLPGERGSFTDTPESAGKYYYIIVPFDANGASPSATTRHESVWVGHDTGLKSLGAVTATVIDDNTVSVAFDAVTEGTNGGYVDPADIGYKITRTKGSGSAVTLEDCYTGALPYTDNTVNELDSYKYTVYTVYRGSTSWTGTTSNTVACGGTIELPYSQDFNSSSALDLFTRFHGPECTRDWGLSSSAANFWGGTVADAWLVTPPFMLEKGKAYEISYTVRVSRAASPKNLAVALGTAPDAASLSDILIDETISTAIAETRTIMFSATSDGKYHIGFHCHGTTDSNDLYVDNLAIREVNTTPLAVENLTVTAGAAGALSAGITLTAPTQSNAGTQLESISRIDVLRGNEIALTFTDPQPGAILSSTDTNVPQAGFHTYSAIAYLGETASPTTTASPVWIGIDQIPAVESVTASLDNDGGSVNISFTPVTEGVHGGYIDTDAICYQIVRMPDETVIAPASTLTEVTDSDIAHLPLGKYYYTVQPFVADEYADAAASDKIRLGEALSLPYNPDFSDAEHFELWTFVSDVETSTKSWEWKSNAITLSYASNSPYAYTPPIRISEGAVYKLNVTLSASSGRYHEAVEVVVSSEPTPGEDTGGPARTATNTDGSRYYKSAGVITATNAYDNNHELQLYIYTPGIYHVGFRNITNIYDDPNMTAGNWTCSLKNLNMEYLTNGIENVCTETEYGIYYDTAAAEIKTRGEIKSIEIYTASGMLAGTSAEAQALPAGIYVARAIMANGSVSTLRFAKP